MTVIYYLQKIDILIRNKWNSTKIIIVKTKQKLDENEKL